VGPPFGRRVIVGFRKASKDGDLAQEDKAFDVVDEIGHSDLGRCSGDPDGSDEQPIRAFCSADTCSTRADALRLIKVQVSA
jgi:hypothetical protein